MKEYYDQRQHISLSQLAFDIIEQDKYEFMTQPSRQGLINLIIEAFADKSNADIDKAVIRYKEKLSGDLAQIPESKTKADIISTLSKIRLPRILRGSSKNLNTRDGVMLCQASIRKRHISPTLVGNLVQRHICVFGR